MADKTYVGKARELGKYGDMKLSIKHDQLVPNDKGYVAVIMSRMKEPDKYGNTHTVYLDTFVPTPKTNSDLPF